MGTNKNRPQCDIQKFGSTSCRVRSVAVVVLCPSAHPSRLRASSVCPSRRVRPVVAVRPSRRRRRPSVPWRPLAALGGPWLLQAAPGGSCPLARLESCVENSKNNAVENLKRLRGKLCGKLCGKVCGTTEEEFFGKRRRKYMFFW